MGTVALCCWRCCSMNSGPDAVVIWQLTPDDYALGYCGGCLDLMLDEVDRRELLEPSRLDFLIEPGKLMAVA
ncbi:hypothetical protein Caci_2938 [Catenulispora acidiphila DSM 44928]|uniref:Uncharacterized protein n=1 Tax=Catenulispora acidiphila (strain DSM 44928 / JCM 14897 / NBRC 102108 / NRRL B-24433 / ID139908) TaxID=479433 RepID=C7Q2V5_CATAD|nr:hypothetical protein [Catenulispora acidiphila]ACU71847.1 hypothetical protein Caci_2938 [Catenulispora acidiphila DSM 44928]